jgi:phosphate starvation-inducible membrane PsiE
MFIWAVVCLIATTPIGALLGFMLRFVWTFFAMLLTAGGAHSLFGALSGLVMLFAFVVAIVGITRAFRKDWHGALGWWSTSVAFIGINMTLWLSSLSATRSIWGV